LSIIKCVECKGKVSSYAKPCPHCGHPDPSAPLVKCKNCNRQISLPSEDCPYCGQGYAGWKRVKKTVICYDCGGVGQKTYIPDGKERLRSTFPERMRDHHYSNKIEKYTCHVCGGDGTQDKWEYVLNK